MAWWKSALLMFFALCAAGVVPVAVGGEVLGFWRLTIPHGIPSPYPPDPTPTPTRTPKAHHASQRAVWVVVMATTTDTTVAIRAGGAPPLAR